MKKLLLVSEIFFPDRFGLEEECWSVEVVGSLGDYKVVMVYFWVVSVGRLGIE